MPIHGDGGHAKVVRELVINPPTGWIIAVGNNADRQREARNYTEFSVGIHPRSVISPSATIGDGSVVMAGAIIQADAKIGRHVIINTRSVIEHGCEISDYCHIAPGAVLCGDVFVGEGAFIGAGAILTQGAHVPAWMKVKAMSRFSKRWLGRDERFWKAVDKSSGCWIWQGSKNNNGYGQVHFKGKTHLAHRWSWLLVHGADPGPLLVLHRCDTPACVRPDHLFLGTQAENMADMSAKGRRKGRPTRLIGELVGGSKLKEPHVRAIRGLLKSGRSQNSIAKQFNVSKTCIQWIASNKSWKHI